MQPSEFTEREIALGGLSIYYPDEERSIIFTTREILQARMPQVLFGMSAIEVEQLRHKATRLDEYLDEIKHL